MSDPVFEATFRFLRDGRIMEDTIGRAISKFVKAIAPIDATVTASAPDPTDGTMHLTIRTSDPALIETLRNNKISENSILYDSGCLQNGVESIG